MKSSLVREPTKAALLLRAYKAASRVKPLQWVGHGLALAATAYVAAAVHGSITLANLVLALTVGTVLTVFALIASDLHEAVRSLGGVLLRIDYQKVGARSQDGERVSEARIYKRARSFIIQAKESIDIFTSSMVEADARNTADNDARREYFSAILEVVKARGDSFSYRRIVQAPPQQNLNETFAKARTYRDHLCEMAALEAEGDNVLLKRLDCRRPTTYLVIDQSILLWQINRITGQNNEMEMHGMFFVEDPARELIDHFSREFDYYFDHECRGVNPDLSTR